MFGYHGRYLRVDPRPGRSGCVPLDEATLRQYIGGVGLGAYLLDREGRPDADPLAEDAALVVALSPLVGSPLTTSAKFAVVAMSPLTGRICDALASSHFAIAAKRAGVDAIAVAGACDQWSIALIDGLGRDEPEVSWRPAAGYLGLSAGATEARLREASGTDWQVAAIGPAGERLVPFATISHDGRHAGRGGLGAVLGSKRIKAIAVRGDRRTPLADPSRTVAMARDLSARSLGPATAKYRELGTVANLLVFNRFEALPTRNFQAGRFEGAGRLASSDLGLAPPIARQSCAACTIGCEHIFGRPGGGGGVRLEYESLFALGPLCGVDDASSVLRAASACDDAALDTISAGGTIAFAMEAAERGWIDGKLPSGRALRFGDGEAVVEAIAAIVSGEGLGSLLALGSRRMAGRLGGEAPDIAPHVKGMELPGYDPRRLHAMALGLAVGTRGADHNRSGAYEADFSARVDRLAGDESSAIAAIETEDRSALMDSLILCKFLRGVFADFHAEASAMLRAVVGWDATPGELSATARRIVDARKRINIRAGWTKAEDALPPRLLGGPDSPLTRDRLETMIAAYYRHRGWTEDGLVPGPDRLSR